MLARAERLHRQFFEVGPAEATRAAAWEAPIDVYEYGPELTIWVALPGVPPEKTRVQMEGSRLLVSGVRHLARTPPAAVIRRLEIPHGRFERRIDLPSSAYALEEVHASEGCLRLRLRRLG